MYGFPGKKRHIPLPFKTEGLHVMSQS